MKANELTHIESQVNLSDEIEAITPNAGFAWWEVSAAIRKLIAAIRGRDGVLQKLSDMLIALNRAGIEKDTHIAALEIELACAVEGWTSANAELFENRALTQALREENQLLKEALDSAAVAVGSVGFGG